MEPHFWAIIRHVDQTVNVFEFESKENLNDKLQEFNQSYPTPIESLEIISGFTLTKRYVQHES